MLRFSNIEACGVHVAAISTREDGDCSWKYDENGKHRQQLLASCGLDGNIWSPTQDHGINIISVFEAPTISDSRVAEVADGVICQVPGMAFGITVADCVPVYLYDPKLNVGGIIHAGRAGTASGICKEAVHAMELKHGCQPQDILALIGPSAGPCCYEVDSQNAGNFRALGYPVRNRHLDLWAANKIQLLSAHVPEGQIVISGQCTICNDTFFSYRRGDKIERNIAFMVL